ncbi:hypothetical protein [Aliikangiella coralliicola]|uniref:Capsid protein n=1 Tax=Aliikangiella coralliicola TaxID=2592383 RepID=A0A545U067_9GAMM|nr:hypothetical protein [Aliikangiella coralliicola]TQV82857.1 hypothetical protein FLL46_24110 [Aliikangiella coralliicola]
MAGPNRDPGWPDISSTSASKFIPQIWSGKLVTKFYATTMFAQIANTDYEGEIKALGDTVIIRTVPNITISDYVIGAGLTYQKPTSPSVELSIDKAKSFAFECNDIETHQSDLQLMNDWSNDATEQMRIVIDTDILSNIYVDADVANSGQTAGKISGSFDLGAVGGNSVQLTKANIIDFLVDVGTVMDEQNLPDSERWIGLPSWACGMIKKSDLKDASIAGDAKSILRTGNIGMIDRLHIYRNNNIATAVDGANTVYHSVAGHKSALTFASQMVKMEDVANPFDFGRLVRGLNVYGYKVIKPESLLHCVIRR